MERAAAAGGRNGLAGHTGLHGKNKAERDRIREREKEKKEKIPFLFLEHIFKFKSNLISFEILIKPNYHKMNMQHHVCTNM